MKKQFLLVSMIVLSFTSSWAAECEKEARSAMQKGHHHLVVSFEGLASYSAGFLRKTVIADLVAADPTITSKNYSYTSVEKAKSCILNWRKVHGTNQVISVLGHSFGGGIAVFSLFEKIPSVIIDHALVYDPRTWSTDRLYRKSKNLEQFKAPENVGLFVNFYQRGAMPGYQVEGAENILIKKTSHTRLPGEVSVRSLSLEKILSAN